MNYLKWATIFLILAVIVNIINLGLVINRTIQTHEVSDSNELDPLTVDYFLENGKLVPELQTPLESYEQKTIHK